ncbi:MAG: hypothetical protein IJ509_01950 [Bacilli bacterium]|nr:hypothetical protein [Bacilli bacterium]
MKNNLIKGRCYTSSMIIASNIENSYFVTGLVAYEDGTTHLHSYVEYNDYIIDYTKNLIIKKDVYTKLLKVKELNRINSQDIDYIYNLLLENGILNTDRYMATFGTEIVTNLEKNKKLLKRPLKNKTDFSCLF